ncbi:MAG: tRNA 2-thiouridine(34) synthase MnmA [bacterium]
MSKKVFVMMSGGVDSSVAASILIEQGYDVSGVYMKCWSKDQLDKLGLSQDLYACNWEDDVEDAKAVAKRLNIPFQVWDFQLKYRQKVVEYMINEYRIGRTPNPDVMCNSVIKFGIFYQKAIEKGVDFVATGHYARIIAGHQKLIARSKDGNKDQSYFLWKIKREQLDHILFPVGEFESKAEVRQYAQEKNLITASKKDSQGLCFVGQTPLRQLLLEAIGQKDGDIVNSVGNILGKHQGSHLYTIGQRGKLGLSGGPWFVSKIDIAKNEVIVAHQDEEKLLYGTKISLIDANFFVDYDNVKTNTLSAQIRYRQAAEACSLEQKDGSLEITFNRPVRAIAAGQSIVIYNSDIMLAGAVIDKVLE